MVTKKELLDQLKELGLDGIVSATTPKEELVKIIEEQKEALAKVNNRKEIIKEPKKETKMTENITTVLNTYEDKIKKHISINIVPFTNLSISYDQITEELLEEVQGDIIQWKRLITDISPNKIVEPTDTNTQVSVKAQKPVVALKTTIREGLVGVVNWQEVPDNINAPSTGCKKCGGHNFTYKTGITKTGKNAGNAWHNMGCNECKDGDWPTGNWVYEEEGVPNIARAMTPKVTAPVEDYDESSDIPF